VVVGAVLIVAGLALVWLPLGIVAGGLVAWVLAVLASMPAERRRS